MNTNRIGYQFAPDGDLTAADSERAQHTGAGRRPQVPTSSEQRNELWATCDPPPARARRQTSRAGAQELINHYF